MKSCRRHAFSKSKGKAKGARKLRSCDVSLDPRLISWRVVDVGSNDVGIAGCVGASASDVVGYLVDYRFDDNDASLDVGDVLPSLEFEEWGGDDVGMEVEATGGVAEVNDEVDEIKEMGFIHVGFVWDRMDEDDDWCLVGED